MDAELNSESTSAAGEPGEQSHRESSVPLESETATPAAAVDAAPGEGSITTSAQDEGQAKAVAAQRVEHPIGAEKPSSAGEAGDNQAGKSSVVVASSAADPLGDALAALDRRDYATAQRLFEALGRTDAAAVIEDALAALDRKDFATAQGLFEALGKKSAAAGSATATSAPPRPAPSAGVPIASDARGRAQRGPITSPAEVIPFVDAADRPPPPQAKKAKARRLRSLTLRTGLVLFAVCGAIDILGLPPNGTFAAIKGQAVAGLASAVDVLKAPLEAIRRPSEEERSAIRDLSAALTQVTIRLDQIEQDSRASLDKLSERMDKDSSSRFADIAAKVDRLEKQAAMPATPASESADVVARLDKLDKRVAAAAAPGSELAEITTRLNRLEKRAAVASTPSSEGADSQARLDKGEKRAAAAAANPTKPLPAGPKQSTLVAKAEPSASNEISKPDNPKPLLRDYSVEDVRDGIAVVDSRYGPQSVTPGDFIPGAGRVLRIERRGGDWVVLTSRGVIASGPGPN
jgi:hypothetical protein